MCRAPHGNTCSSACIYTTDISEVQQMSPTRKCRLGRQGLHGRSSDPLSPRRLSCMQLRSTLNHSDPVSPLLMHAPQMQIVCSRPFRSAEHTWVHLRSPLIHLACPVTESDECTAMCKSLFPDDSSSRRGYMHAAEIHSDL